MEIATLLLPIGLGLFGFIEPCTIGAHLVFLGSQEGRSPSARGGAFAIFLFVRTCVMACFGVLVTLLGSVLIEVQTGMWLVFGAAYMMIGVLLLFSKQRFLRGSIRLGPQGWRWAAHPAVQGVAFGLSIPACAAPLIFALLGMTVAGQSITAGAVTMGLFAIALTLPLAPFVFWKPLRSKLSRLGNALRGRKWFPGIVFLALGAWSVWFGLYVDLADWTLE